MTTTVRVRVVLRISLIVSGLIILFLSGAWAVEEYFVHIRTNAGLAGVSAARVIALTNEERSGERLPELSVSPLLTRAAQLKAEDMAAREYYAHVSPDGKTPLYWLDRVGYRYLNAGENLVIDRTTSEQVVSAWMHSEDHRENILRPQFTEIGVGVAIGRYKGEDTIFVVQEFGTPYPSVPLARTAVAPTPVPATGKPQSTPLRSPDPLPLPALAPALPAAPSAGMRANTLVENVETLTNPVLESLASLPPLSELTGQGTASARQASSSATGLHFELPLAEPQIILLPAEPLPATAAASPARPSVFRTIIERMKALWISS